MTHLLVGETTHVLDGETTRGRNDTGRNDSRRTGKWAKRPVTLILAEQMIRSTELSMGIARVQDYLLQRCIFSN